MQRAKLALASEAMISISKILLPPWAIRATMPLARCYYIYAAFQEKSRAHTREPMKNDGHAEEIRSRRRLASRHRRATPPRASAYDKSRKMEYAHGMLAPKDE